MSSLRLTLIKDLITVTEQHLPSITEARRDAECLYGAAEVEQALQRMAQAISERLKDSDPLCLCVLTGGIMVTGQLLSRLDFPLQLDSIHASRYRGTTQGRDLHWKKYPDSDLAGQTVLLIDDILDEGLTLRALVDYCQAQGAKEVLTAVLVEKQQARHPDGLPYTDFCGLSIPNRYVFGYGLDYHKYWRNAAGIYAVKGL